MPLVKEGRLTALMAIHDSAPRVWTQNELALLTEVTERSWAHIERVRSDQSAAETAERLSLATQAAAIGIWDYDPVADHLRWDAQCRALFGITSDDEVTYEGSFIAGLHPDDRIRADEAVRRAIAPDSLEGFNIEYRTIGLEDRIERWVAASGHGDIAFYDHGRRHHRSDAVIIRGPMDRSHHRHRHVVIQQEDNNGY